MIIRSHSTKRTSGVLSPIGHVPGRAGARCLRLIFSMACFFGLQTAFSQTKTDVGASPAAPFHKFLNQYCTGCHNERLKTGGLVLDKVDIEHVEERPEV